MLKNRRGEGGRVPFRSGRFFSVNGAWFFSTREGQEKGPFSSKAVAEAALLNFVRDRGFAHSRTRPIEVKHDDNADQPGTGHRFYW